ncbi:uncharacterized protein LOC101847926 [Aplysia californica]|uniref:Uncharacterized protein LOC101847926 n=1 Tax=Aplysia californica TaxID=6500 RepID=A0ABM0JCI1_APLCA|nr:uncharacterized protein LOC101847926 [Aplysia californica]
MSYSQTMKLRAEPVDERGDLKENPVTPRDHPPPPIRLDSLTFPTDRLPQLDVQIVSRLPDVGREQAPRQPGSTNNQNIDPNLPLAVIPEKNLFNLWAETQTQTELHWSKPENADKFNSIVYQIQLKEGNGGEWVNLADNRLPLFRIYFVDGKALFGRVKITQSSSTTVVHMRIRPVGIVESGGREERRIGPWSENILFSLEASADS